MQLTDTRHYEDISDDENVDEKLGLSHHWRKMKEKSHELLTTANHHKFTDYTCDPSMPFGVLNSSPVAWSFDGDKYAYVSGSYSIYIRSLSSSKTLILDAHINPVTSVLFHPSHNIVISAGGDALIVWDLQTQQPLSTLPVKPGPSMHDSEITALCWGHNNSVLFTASTDMTIIAWRYVRGKLEFVEQWAAHRSPIHTLVYDSNCHRLVSGGRDAVIKVYDISGLDAAVANITVTKKNSIVENHSPSSFPDSASNTNSITLDTEEGKSSDDIMTIPDDDDDDYMNLGTGVGTTNIIATPETTATGDMFGNTDTFSSDLPSLSGMGGLDMNKLYGDSDSDDEDDVAVASRQRELKNTVSKVLLLHTLEGHRGDITSLAFLHKGVILVSGSCDNCIKLWDLRSGKYIRDVIGGVPGGVGGAVTGGHKGDVTCIIPFSSGVTSRDDLVGEGVGVDDRLLTSGGDGCVKYWTLATDLITIVNTPYSDTVSLSDVTETDDFDYNPDANTTVTTEDDRIFDVVDTTHCIMPSIAHLSHNKTKNLIIAAGINSQIQIWDISNSEKFNLAIKFLGHLEAVNTICAFKSDSSGNYNIFSSSNDGLILEHRLSDGKLVGNFNNPINTTAITVSDSGDLIFVAGGDYNIKVYQRYQHEDGYVSYSSVIALLKGHYSKVLCLSYNPVDEVLVSGGMDYHVRVFDLKKIKGGFEPFAPTMSPTISNPVSNAVNISQVTVTTDIFTDNVDKSVVLECSDSMQPSSGHILSLAFNPTWNTLACGTSDHALCVISLRGNANVIGKSVNINKYFNKAVLGRGGHKSVITSVCWENIENNAIQRLFTSSADKTIVFWDYNPSSQQLTYSLVLGSPLATSKRNSKTKGHYGKITSITTCNEGKYLLTSSADETIIAWDIKTGEPIVSFATITPDGAFTAMNTETGSIIAGTENGMLVQYPKIDFSNPQYKPRDSKAV